MPSIGGPELIIILLIVVIVFGIGRLPEVGGGLGKGIREFRRSVTGKDDDPADDADETKSDNGAA
ncbi:MAG: twin-arginine translocase TatA/TatE family subunit [Chloroflexi bacterium]|jgi:sec-independent protein translocase protein TatA|nr:twin-arginine translocase TatA/TatE family subunit [Chloroflexota bacterium]MBT5319764.1 twin-arginine translocase TatA/TatE family subunit [Chloroflexota bacterium]MBT6680779.1 twin-arginine translocase TatA/TatE family subunit [Chloroflexota bacterium]